MKSRSTSQRNRKPGEILFLFQTRCQIRKVGAVNFTDGTLKSPPDAVGLVAHTSHSAPVLEATSCMMRLTSWDSIHIALDEGQDLYGQKRT